MEDYLMLATGTWQSIVQREQTPTILPCRKKLLNSSVMASNVKDEVAPMRNMETTLRATVIFVPESSRTLNDNLLLFLNGTQLNCRKTIGLKCVLDKKIVLSFLSFTFTGGNKTKLP